ncbi:uncharacterized protein LOC111258785 [Varroa jacobsoni]|uniref:uncharacterized protein LOC111258785 n=1 Tax=Varroa jacobsoni TaxID=62625 RepID=UPI000BF2D113|nr:uncharacterized protein LOC111258785 [Varroa jacobsoni]
MSAESRSTSECSPAPIERRQLFEQLLLPCGCARTRLRSPNRDTELKPDHNQPTAFLCDHHSNKQQSLSALRTSRHPCDTQEEPVQQPLVLGYRRSVYRCFRGTLKTMSSVTL